jgi:cell division protein FtsL
MLQAESSYARDWNLYNVPETVNNQKTMRKTTYKVNHKRKLIVKSIALIFGYALILVFLCKASATLGYQIEKLEQDVQGLETATYRLDYAIAEKSSLDRVESIATKELGMTKPDSASSIKMETKSEAVQVANVNENSTDSKSVSQKFLNKMYDSLSQLAQK